MKILVVRFSSIGDIVLTTPVVRCLAKQHPNAEIHYLTKPQFASIVEPNPNVHRVHVLKEDWSEMTKDLKAEKFDVLVDLHHNVRTLRLKYALGVKAYSFNKINFQKWLMVNFKWNKLPDEHIVDRYLATTRFFDVVDDGFGLDYFLKDEEVQNVNEWLKNQNIIRFIALSVGAAHRTKCLTKHQIVELTESMDAPVVLLGGPGEKEDADWIQEKSKGEVHNAVSVFSIGETAACIDKSEIVISHDTGVMHIAAALKKPLHVIWGNTIPQFGMQPYYGKDEVYHRNYEVNDLSCRPCSKIGFEKCPKKHFNCIMKLDIAKIAAETSSFFFSDESQSAKA